MKRGINYEKDDESDGEIDEGRFPGTTGGRPAHECRAPLRNNQDYSLGKSPIKKHPKNLFGGERQERMKNDDFHVTFSFPSNGSDFDVKFGIRSADKREQNQNEESKDGEFSLLERAVQKTLAREKEKKLAREKEERLAREKEERLAREKEEDDTWNWLVDNWRKENEKK